MPAYEDAKAAVLFVRTQMGVTSTNFPADLEQHSSNGISDEMLQLTTNRATALRSALTEKYSKKGTGSSSSLKYESCAPSVAASAAAALQFRTGNCEAQAALAYAFLVENTESKVQLVNIRGYDHSFLIVGRTQGTFLDLSTWNADAFACDPWASDVYLVSQLVSKMKELYKTSRGAGGIEDGESEISLGCQLDSTDKGDKLPFRVTPEG